MSRTFSRSVASPYPTKPFDPGAGNLDPNTPVLCGDDKIDWATSGTWTKCSSQSAANAILFGERWTRTAMSWICWSHATETGEPPNASFAGVKHQGRPRWQLLTDKLRSYGVGPPRGLPTSVTHRTGQYKNNRAGVSHQHTREQERQMRRFKSAAQLHDFSVSTAQFTTCSASSITEGLRVDHGTLDHLTPRIPPKPMREPFEDAYEVIELLICEALNSYKIIYSGFWASPEIGRKLLKKMVGARGFEPPTSCSQSRRATGLRHAPTGGLGSNSKAGVLILQRSKLNGPLKLESAKSAGPLLAKSWSPDECRAGPAFLTAWRRKHAVRRIAAFGVKLTPDPYSKPDAAGLAVRRCLRICPPWPRPEPADCRPVRNRRSARDHLSAGEGSPCDAAR